MKTLQVVITTAALLTGATAFAQGRPMLESLSPEQQLVATTWLRQDCTMGNEELVKELIVTGPELELSFWEAFELGPTEEERAELGEQLAVRYQQRQLWLKENAKEAVDPALAEPLLAQSEEEFRVVEEQRHLNRYRDAALSGLAQVCTEESVGRLHEIAKDESHPSSLAAREVLASSEDCSVH